MLALPMELDGPIPARVLTIAVGQPLRPVWRNQLGGLTYQIGTGPYVKWSPHGSGIDLAQDACPFSWTLTDRVGQAHASLDAGELDGAPWHEDYRALGLDAAMRRLAEPPPDDVQVVGHGDPCAPNMLIGDDGRWSGHVDLGVLGIGDRWADLAVASWSLTWNYEGDWQAVFFDTYGIAPDRERIDYYRLLYELTP